MPIGHNDDGWKARYYPLQQVLEEAERQGWHTSELGRGIRGNGPSQDYRIEGARGTFGLIHPVSDHFCETCNRLRLTADGNIKPCLFWSDEFQVRRVIGDDEALRAMFLRALDSKPQSHEMAKQLMDEQTSHSPTMRRMSQIGG